MGKKKVGKDEDKRLSLYPLEFEEAIEGILKIKPLKKTKKKSGGDEIRTRKTSSNVT